MSALRNIRRARGLTQESLAEAINTTGVSVSRYERDERKLTLPLLRRLATVLNCSISDIIGEGENAPGGSLASPGVDWIRDLRLDQFHRQNDQPEDVKEFPINENRVQGIATSDINKLVVVELINSGDAMSPLLDEGDMVLLDTNVKQFVRDGVYLILSARQPEFRRLAKNPDARLFSVLSENPSHPDFEGISASKLNILGLALWYCSHV